MTDKELQEVLRKHSAWLRGDADGVRANLSYVDLSYVDLSRANLSRANLSYANLSYASLSYASLSRANLFKASLTGANLTGANLTDCRGLAFQIPQEGALTVYKKLRDGVIAKLLVPAAAARTATPVGRKCRAEYVEVLALDKLPDDSYAEAYDKRTGRTFYSVGQTVRPDSYDPDWRVECTHGIHFFLTREEAEDYS